MSYLVSDLVQETKRFLTGMHAAELNLVSGTVQIADTNITLQYSPANIARGSYLAIDDEIVYVWSVAPTTNQLVVQRGMLGTTAAQHVNSMVEVNPRYATYAIRYALRAEIRSWGPQVYRVKSTTIQTVAGVRGYDLQELVDDNFYNIISVRRSTPSTIGSANAESWPKIRNWQIIRNASVADFPSGVGFVIPFGYEFQDIYDASGSFNEVFTQALPTLNIVYSTPFDVDVNSFADNTDIINQVGLDETMIDIPPIGAAWRLLSQREAMRTQTEAQGQPVDLQFVPPMYALKAAEGFKMLRDSRLSDAQVWLINRYGIENWGV